MKVSLVVLAALFLAACNKPAVVVAPPTPAPTPVPTPEIAMATPAPRPAPATPSDLAPDGVYFLTSATSITTEDGVMGFKPGQLLHKAADGSYTANGAKLTLTEDQVTNSLSRARAIATGENAQELATRRYLANLPTPTPLASQTPDPVTRSQNIPITQMTGDGAVHDRHRSPGYYDWHHIWHYY